MFEKILKVTSIQRVSSRSSHSAFTSLVAWGEHFLCSYRQATDHVSGDGRIEISAVNTAGGVLFRQHLSFAGWDLRDPKLSVDHNGRFWLIAYARRKCGETGHIETCMKSWFSDTGESWSSGHTFGERLWWLWRVTWHQKSAFGLAYNRGLNRLDLCIGHPNAQMKRLSTPAISWQRDKLGYPNESDLNVADDGTITALVRRDADSFSAQLGVSKPPYRYWQWRDLKDYIGGPVMAQLTANTALVAGRRWTGKKLLTQLWVLHFPTAMLSPCLTLPSGGDTSYPGIVLKGDIAYLSYYSSHVYNETRVYFAQIEGINALRDIVE